MANPSSASHLPAADVALLHDLAANLQSSSLSVSEAACTQFCAHLDIYLPLSTLLDPLLPSLVPPLFALASARLSAFAALPPATRAQHSSARPLLPPFAALYALAKVRGRKPFSRHLPHGVSDLQSLAAHLAFTHRACPSPRFWRVRYVLLVAAAVAVQIPFPLHTVLHPPALTAAILAARTALPDPGPISAAAATFLARLLARRDASAYRDDLLLWAVHDGLPPSAPRAIRVAALALLAAVFKFAHRDDLRPHVAPVRDALSPLLDAFLHTPATTTREAHLLAKLAARLALAVLPPRTAAWRYSRGTRIVFERTSDRLTRTLPRSLPTSAGHIGVVDHNESDEQHLLDDDGLHTLEAVVEVLITGLQHADTVVRWSAAKGIGRITARLPLPLAQDVVDSVIHLFGHAGEARADAAWHGGCLALAELARRGLLLPKEPQFAMTFDVIAKAATFDMRRGANSVGAHVRDAACYAVWAMARAYSKEDVAPYARKITDSMLPVALLDREINCRRAAAAALQECVGRLSEALFRDGIQLITLADYFSLGDRVSAYLTIAPKVASLADGEHFDCILHELAHKKLAHWDPTIRTLASKGIAALVTVDSHHVIPKRVVPELLRLAKEKGDMVIRHGAVLGLAEIANVIGASGLGDTGVELRALPRALKERNMFSGRTGDEMRLGCCHLIEKMATGAGDLYVCSQVGRDDAEYALEFLESIFGSGKENMYTKATSAYAAICNDVIANDAEWHIKVSRRILRGLAKGGVAVYQRGFALAAGVCGDSPIAKEIVTVLGRETSGNPDVEVRRNAVLSLSRLPQRICVESLLDIFAALISGMNDYTIDERGDVGSWVREASMRAASEIVEALFSDGTKSPDMTWGDDEDVALMGLLRGIVQQCCGRIDRTRVVAGASLTTFCKIFAAQKQGFKVSQVCKTVGTCFGISTGDSDNRDQQKTVNFGETDSVFPAVRLALDVEDVSGAVLVGLVSAGGGMGHQSKAALDSLVTYFRNITEPKLKQNRLRSIVQIIESGNDRLTVPTYAVLEALVTRKALAGINQLVLVSLVHTVRASWRQKLRNVKRMMAAVQLLGELAGLSITGDCFDFRQGSLGRACLEALVIVLGGTIPRLRRVTAECIYLILIDYAEDDEDCLGADEREYVQKECPSVREALDTLLDTEWEYLDTLAARERRTLLCKLLKIKSPIPAKSLRVATT